MKPDPAKAKATAAERARERFLANLARLREERFLDREARILADPDMDPRVKALYLDRTLCDTAAVARELGISAQRVTIMKTGVRKPGRLMPPGPHPGFIPDFDVITGRSGDSDRWAIELGRLREWVVWKGTHRLDPATGKLVKRPESTHGAPRKVPLSRRPNRG